MTSTYESLINQLCDTINLNKPFKYNKLGSTFEYASAIGYLLDTVGMTDKLSDHRGQVMYTVYKHEKIPEINKELKELGEIAALKLCQTSSSYYWSLIRKHFYMRNHKLLLA